MFKKESEIMHNKTFDIEIESMKINGNNYSVYYETKTDSVHIIKWDDWHEDIECFIDTSKFESFADDCELETFEDVWNYETESVYQTYSTMDFDDYIMEYGNGSLEEHVENEITKHGITFIKRPLKQRIKRFFEKIKYKIKNYAHNKL